jgi:NADP-dependent 3-hydroxy acid dehydrogenase YdfG
MISCPRGGLKAATTTTEVAAEGARVFLAGRTESSLQSTAVFAASDRARSMTAATLNVSARALIDQALTRKRRPARGRLFISTRSPGERLSCWEGHDTPQGV